MQLYVFLLLLCGARAINLEYLDPTKLQTITSAEVQRKTAQSIISRYSQQVTVDVNPLLFSENKDVFSVRTSQGLLNIRASSGVAALWGFHYYLKKYCKSHISWQVQRVSMPSPLPEVDEVVVANDRFRYYQNVCTASYSFVWWSVNQWTNHVEWMAFNGINLALAPIAQESAWAKVYRQFGMTQDEIDDHFTGPAFLSWLRMGNVHGWGGPLLKSWHDQQLQIQDNVVEYMYNLGMIPVLPAFNGHVPKAFSRIYPNTTFYSVDKWNKFGEDYCCGLFMDPSSPYFRTIGMEFLRVMSAGIVPGHIYTADPFNEVKIQLWSTGLIKETTKAIYETITIFDNKAVWLVQNWMFVKDPILWPEARVKAFLTSVPNGRMLVLDLQSEQWPQYDLYNMYCGQPFIWCMLHNFGGTLGMFGNVITISQNVYHTRSKPNSTMIGIGLTPEGINQNYVVYDLMLESAWRKQPIEDLDVWVGEYAERRYGCNATTDAWRYLLKSVYSFNGLNMMRGKYVITRRPSFKIKPWAWYKSHDLFQALNKFVFVKDQNCFTDSFYYDLVDVTRQALQYRAEQLYLNILENRMSTIWDFNATISQFLDVMTDMQNILGTNDHFSATTWLDSAKSFATDASESYIYELNSRNQITLWGPNGEISDYACKQWAEMFRYYYIPRWTSFLNAALDAKVRDEIFDERRTQSIIRATVEEKFLSVTIEKVDPQINTIDLALQLYEKWAYVPDLADLPINVISLSNSKIRLADVDLSSEESDQPSVVMISTVATYFLKVQY